MSFASWRTLSPFSPWHQYEQPVQQIDHARHHESSSESAAVPTRLLRVCRALPAEPRASATRSQRAPHTPPTHLQHRRQGTSNAGLSATFYGVPKDSLRGKGFYARMGSCRAAARYGRLAQRERRSLTRTRSLVQIRYRPPEKSAGQIIQMIWPDLFFIDIGCSMVAKMVAGT